jgi:hypothetical protein
MRGPLRLRPPLPHRLTSTGRHVAAKAAKAPWALEPVVALGHPDQTAGDAGAPWSGCPGGPQPSGRGLRAHVAATYAWGGCTPVQAFGGTGNLGADVVATNTDRFLVVVPGGLPDLRRFGGTCCAVHEADVAVVVTTSSAAAPADEYAATCGRVCVDGASWPPGPNQPHGRPGWRAAASTHRGCPRGDGTLLVGRAIAHAPAGHRRCLSSLRTLARGSAAGSTREVP